MHDCIIIGLGAMGSATAWQLSQTGASILAFDQYEAGHSKGSSHGRTRVIRRVYSEGDLYMPLLSRAYVLWKNMARDAGRDFLIRTGGLDIGYAGAPGVKAAEDTARTHGITHEHLTAEGVMARYPAFDIPHDYEAVFAPDSGMLLSDAANAWMRGQAVKAGADLRWNTRVTGWRREGDHYVVDTRTGSHPARKLVIAAGPWTGQFVPELDSALTVERQVVAWFDPLKELSALPVFQVEPEDGVRPYVMPPVNADGLKIGVYGHFGECGPDMRDGFEPSARDEGLLRSNAERWLPGSVGKTQMMMDCRFTRTQDDRFIIGNLPGDPGVTILSPCSGHGYKFAPAIGEAAANLVLEHDPKVDLEPFGVIRAV